MKNLWTLMEKGKIVVDNLGNPVIFLNRRDARQARRDPMYTSARIGKLVPQSSN